MFSLSLLPLVRVSLQLPLGLDIQGDCKAKQVYKFSTTQVGLIWEHTSLSPVRHYELSRVVPKASVLCWLKLSKREVKSHVSTWQKTRLMNQSTLTLLWKRALRVNAL